MDTERWQRVDQIFDQALELSGAERPAFLAAASSGDEELRCEVEHLLAADRKLDGFLEQPLHRDDVAEIFGAARQPWTGGHLGDYRLLRVLGSGGSGTVYLAARDGHGGGERFALKLCRYTFGATELRRRFEIEHRILAHLDHLNIARLHHGGVTEDGHPFLVMELVEGTSIDRHCHENRLSIGERLGRFRQLCSAVGYVHDNELVHRDLKPANVLVTEDGRVKLLDFGIAKLLAPERFSETPQPTRTGLRLMTAGYASPEQMLGEPVMPASDIYSLGVLLFELLAGVSPYRLEGPLPLAIERAVCEDATERMSDTLLRLLDSDTSGHWDEVDVFAASRQRGFADPRELALHLTGDLDDIVAMALRKRPARRYASAEELSEDVRRHLEGAPVAARRASSQVLKRWRRLRPRVGRYLKRAVSPRRDRCRSR